MTWVVVYNGNYVFLMLKLTWFEVLTHRHLIFYWITHLLLEVRMRDSTALPNLMILPTDFLLLHEDFDPRRAEKLSHRILAGGLLKHPPIVAPIPNTDLYVVLDGANRTSAFALAGISHIVAQVVDYNDPDIIVDTWYHVVSGVDFEVFDHGLTNIDHLQLLDCSLDEARRALAQRAAIAYIVCERGVRLVIPPAGGNLGALKLLNQIVATYRGKADIYRASNDIWEIQKPYYPDITALLIFAPLQPADIIEAALGDQKIPTGITRHIVPARALNINFPVGILMSSWSLERKRAWLREWLMERMAANAIRYYAESTFSFNE